MIKKLILTGLIIGLLTAPTLVLAADVYVTTNGKKYHKEVCRFIKNREATKIDEKDALAKGLEKCNKCFPDKQEISKSTKIPK